MERENELLLKQKLEDLQKRLGKKQMFEEAVSSIRSLLRDSYSSASPSLQKSFYSAVCRVATVLKTRYTAPGFWNVGLGLFLEAEHLMYESYEREHLQSCIAQAREQLTEVGNQSEGLVSSPHITSRGYLFEGHLTVDPEPPQPEWLVQSNLARNVADLLLAESSRAQMENNNTSEDADNLVRLQELVDRLDDIVPMPESLVQSNLARNVADLLLAESSQAQMENNNTSEDADILVRLQELVDRLNDIVPMILENGPVAPRVPPASKQVVAKLPITTITEEILAKLGPDAECAICKENLVASDKMQELPCKHTFHPPCLKPWLDEHNSCPICRHELQTDDHAYESWKEREKEAEEDRKGAANAVRGGEYMYV